MGSSEQPSFIDHLNRDDASWLGLPMTFWRFAHGVFAAQPHLEAVVVYGSRGRGDFREDSDLDLCLFGPDLTYDEYRRLAVRIEFDDSNPCHIDFAHWERSSNELWRQEVRYDALLFFNRAGSTDLPFQLNPRSEST